MTKKVEIIERKTKINRKNNKNEKIYVNQPEV